MRRYAGRMWGVALVASALLVLGGCRREDIREMTVSLPDLTEANSAKVVDALKVVDPNDARRTRYLGGVYEDSFRFDYANRTLTLRYDSMKIAQANIRYAIDEKGLKVKFPEKTDDRAGY